MRHEVFQVEHKFKQNIVICVYSSVEATLLYSLPKDCLDESGILIVVDDNVTLLDSVLPR